MFFDAVLTFLFVFSCASLKSDQLIQGALKFSTKIQTIVESSQTGNKDEVGFHTLRREA